MGRGRPRLEVFVQNDVTAAANGESMFGVARELDNYLLFYIGAKVSFPACAEPPDPPQRHQHSA